MSENASNLLTLNPVIVYLTLALYGLLFALMFVYLHGRFRAASRVLGMLQNDWDSAQTKHTGLLEHARDRLSRIPAETPAPVKKTTQTPPQPARLLTTDVRSQVVAMGKRGMGTTEIARSTGLPEGEVDVLLGMARMQR